MKQNWQTLWIIKGTGALALSGFVFFIALRWEGLNGVAFSSGLTDSKTLEKGASNVELPAIPEGQISLSNAGEIRNQLLLIRKNVEAKIQALAQSKSSLEKTRDRVGEELKMLSEQKKIMEESLQSEKKVKEDRIKEALTFIEKMEPRKASPVIETMDRDLVIALFKRLPARNVTRILENINPTKATELMEYYTRIRSGREYELLKELGLCQATSSQDPDSDSSSKSPSTELATAGQPLSAAQTTSLNSKSPEVPLESKPTTFPSPVASPVASPSQSPASDKSF